MIVQYRVQELLGALWIRNSVASQAYGSMCSLWLWRKYVSERSRLKLYSSLVLPVLLYNCETWGVPQAVFQRLDCFHRRQLRNLMGVRYPDRITNDDLYSRCGLQPLSELVAKRCRSLTGHVLRMSEQSPLALRCPAIFKRGHVDEGVVPQLLSLPPS